jgi:aspartate carbamoyltransferase regulatory subunit
VSGPRNWRRRRRRAATPAADASAAGGTGHEPSHRVAKLRAGTVVDHLPAGRALRCLAVLGVPREGVVTVGLNLPSRRMKRKDILKMENRVLTAAERARIAFLGPGGTVCVIANFRVVRKIPLELPTVVDGVVKCPNPSCITHHDPVTPRVRVDSSDPVRLRCHYCERRIRADEVEFLHGSALPAPR